MDRTGQKGNDEISKALASLTERGLIEWAGSEPVVTDTGLVAILAAIEKGNRL